MGGTESSSLELYRYKYNWSVRERDESSALWRKALCAVPSFSTSSRKKSLYICSVYGLADCIISNVSKQMKCGINSSLDKEKMACAFKMYAQLYLSIWNARLYSCSFKNINEQIIINTRKMDGKRKKWIVMVGNQSSDDGPCGSHSQKGDRVVFWM